MASITSWIRLEPRARDAEMAETLAGRVRDPLWLLARQWQFGEFAGEDAGSPVSARLRADSTLLTRYFPAVPAAGANQGVPLSQGIPLDAVVEREAQQPAASDDLRVAVEAGLHFVRLLEDAKLAAYVPAYLVRYELEPPSAAERDELDGETLALRELSAGRVADGAALYVDLLATVPDGKLPEQPEVDSGDAKAMLALATSWLDAYSQLFSPGVGGAVAWSPGRLEYRFAVGARTASGEATFVAAEHAGGRLEWFSFDLDPGSTLGAAKDSQPQEVVRTIVPAPVTFGGMPAARWWEFEDVGVDFGSIETGPQDLGRMLLIEFGLAYGNDFFVVPIDLPVGSICETRSLVVTDTFGERLLIEHASVADGSAAAWRLFEPSVPAAATAPRFFLLPPVLGHVLESEPVEEVLFLRDEMANMAWAVERAVLGPSGQALDRFEALQARRRREEVAKEAASPGSTAPPAGPLEYKLASEVPDYWYPLLPVSVGGRSTALRLGGIPEGGGAVAGPLGRILDFDASTVLLAEEEIPRSGAEVTRRYRRARWVDGSTHLWIGHRKRPGRGEGSSGLRFDRAEPT